MNRMIKMLLTMILTAAPFYAQAQPASSLPPREIASRAINVMAGSAWEKARYFSFSFNVERDGKIAVSYPQRWDRYTGDYRVSGKDREGHEFDIRMNVNTRQGTALLDGKPAADPKELLERGYRRFINDTWWLLMPLKMLDPGTRLESAGVKQDECGLSHDVLKLSFEQGVGLTPGDQYWIWISRDSGLVDRWEMLLQDSKDERPTVVFLREYGRYANLILSTLKEEDNGIKIKFTDLVVSSEVPAGAFR